MDYDYLDNLEETHLQEHELVNREEINWKVLESLDYIQPKTKDKHKYEWKGLTKEEHEEFRQKQPIKEEKPETLTDKIIDFLLRVFISFIATIFTCIPIFGFMSAIGIGVNLGKVLVWPIFVLIFLVYFVAGDIIIPLFI